MRSRASTYPKCRCQSRLAAYLIWHITWQIYQSSLWQETANENHSSFFNLNSISWVDGAYFMFVVREKTSRRSRSGSLFFIKTKGRMWLGSTKLSECLTYIYRQMNEHLSADCGYNESSSEKKTFRPECWRSSWFVTPCKLGWVWLQCGSWGWSSQRGREMKNNQGGTESQNT